MKSGAFPFPSNVRFPDFEAGIYRGMESFIFPCLQY